MGQLKEVLFTDLESAAIEKERISRTRGENTWEAVEYETEKYSGVMLIAAQEAKPEEITIPLGLHGWYHIYLGLIKLNGPMYTYFKLDSDVAFSGISTRKDGKDGAAWASYEIANEIFWKSACLSGDRLHIIHPQMCLQQMSGVLWIRCVEMSPAEIEAHLQSRQERGPYKIHAHIDSGPFGRSLKTPDEALAIMQYLQGTDVTMCSQECALEYSEYCDEASSEGYMGLRAVDRIRNQSYVEFEKIRKESYRRMIDYCRSIDVRLHAVWRMQLSSFQFPCTYPTFRMRFADEHPEFAIQTREGRTINVLSFAYPEVREFTIGVLLDLYRQGFDGVTLLWIRGNSFGFEEPVLKRIAEKYNGLDGRRLPMADERLHGVWCEFMNEFMRDLRTALDAEAEKTGRARCNVHNLTMYTPELSRQMGLDVETWAKEGWIDGITASMYACYEDLDGCMADDGLIDMEKYSEAIRHRFILKRKYLMDRALMCQGIREYEAIAEKYPIETYYSLNWENQSPAVYAQEAEEFYRSGAKGIHAWDVNFRVEYPPEWIVTSRLGHPENCATAAEQYESLGKRYRVLKLGGNDISYICANWRG